MKSAGQTYQKMKQARFRHVKREIDNLLKQTPRNCANNSQAKTSTGILGVCKIDCQTCDAQVNDRSGACGEFTQIHGREDVKKSLQDFFFSRTIPEIAIRYPDVAALLWVLDGEELEGEEIPEGREDYFPGSILVGTYCGVKLWVDSDAEAKNISASIQSLTNLQEIVPLQRNEIETLKGSLSDAFSQVQALREENQRLRESQSLSDNLLKMVSESHQSLSDSQRKLTESWENSLKEKSERIAALEQEVVRLSASLLAAPTSFWARLFK